MGLLVALVGTHNPGNLGAAARAAKNFGASLLLVAPRAERSHPDARAYASGAGEFLDEARIVSRLDDVRRRADLLVALSSLRGRAARGLPPALSWAFVRAEARKRRVALVFGPERGGLTTEELRTCDARLRISTSDAFPTLNLAQAVAVALALARPARRDSPSAGPAATSIELARLLAAFRTTLSAAGYPGKGRSREVLAELEAFLRRGRPTTREVTLLLGALAALRRAVRQSR